MYRIKKTDHALICFFDQVFDQGLNKAVPWTAYWTPLRYVLLFKVSALFDLELLKKAWDARITTNDALANEKFIRVCGVLLSRVGTLPDARSREIISDSLRWAMKYPEEIHYNVYKKKDSLDISPNLIGFQSVLHGITSRLKLEGESAVKIIVDRQSQFNKAQESIASYYRKARGQELPLGVGLPVMDLKDFPNVPISCTAGTDSVGLEIVDIYLWAFKRFFEKKSLPPDLRRLILNKVDNVYTDSVSLEAIYNRWGEVMLNLPEPTDEQKELVKEILEKQENARRPHVQSL